SQDRKSNRPGQEGKGLAAKRKTLPGTKGPGRKTEKPYRDKRVWPQNGETVPGLRNDPQESKHRKPND
ncbi:hypothetical protein, partial [Alistipes shahii]|uniref:hypothetical protein n=1 Tax=Alistipes shahii TaxID=328814 RepID=UPI002671B595